MNIAHDKPHSLAHGDIEHHAFFDCAFPRCAERA